MPKSSAGLLMFRRRARALEVLLVHPGGPFWQGRDEGAWTIPKGEFAAGQDPLEAARREFAEETGHASEGPFLPLTPVRQRSGKTVAAWAFEGDLDPERIRSNEFEMEWPPRSGRTQRFPEVDRGGWFSLEEASIRVRPEQRPLLEELARMVRGPGGDRRGG